MGARSRAINANSRQHPGGEVQLDGYPRRMASPLDVADLRQRVEKALTTFLAGQAATLHAVGEELVPVYDAAATFLLDAGKRLRPAFGYWGWRGAGGADGEEIVTAVSCLELLHACALVHDDVMDASDTRRGHPSVHRKFAALHRKNGWTGDPEAFGRAAAILLGDLYLVWADAMLSGSGLAAEVLLRAQPVYDEMRVELMAGEYLDVLAKAVGGTAHSADRRDQVDRALRVARYKSGKYTIERPLHLGAALAGAGADVTAAYSAYGLPLGEAFQLRDDILGVFGDPEVTGKPAGDDLREGKRTALIAHAGAAASPAQAQVLAQHLGDPHLDPDGVQALREVIVDTGALSAVERLIDDKTAQAVVGLRDAPLTTEAVRVLSDLATAATTRLG
jgi:geranylgeranyl diphosphate synthase type I